jgi:hypothetical protein
VIVALTARAAILAAVVGFTRRRFGFALRFYAAALVPALVASGLDFSGRAVLYAYLIWGGLVVVIATFLILGAVPWTGQATLRAAFADARRARFRLGSLAVSLVALAVIGAAWRRPGDAIQVLVVPFSGALTAVMALRLSAPARRRLSSRAVAIVTAACVLTLVVIAVVVPGLGGSSKRATPRLRAGSLMLVAGVDTSTGNGALFKFDPRAIGFSCRQTFYYSYAGPGPGGRQGVARCPIRRGAPYRKADTTRRLQQLAAGLRAQLRDLPRPVVVVTHSQGAWIAWSEMTGPRAVPVDALVMLAPFNQGLAPYPAPGRDGAGAAGGTSVRFVADLGRDIGISRFDPDAPLAHELQGTPGAVNRLVSRRLPRSVRTGAVLARADLPLEPRPWPHDVPEACPGWLTHAALPTSARVTTSVERFLEGHDLPACPSWITTLGHSTDAFGAPPPGSESG